MQRIGRIVAGGDGRQHAAGDFQRRRIARACRRPNGLTFGVVEPDGDFSAGRFMVCKVRGEVNGLIRTVAGIDGVGACREEQTRRSAVFDVDDDGVRRLRMHGRVVAVVFRPQAQRCGSGLTGDDADACGIGKGKAVAGGVQLRDAFIADFPIQLIDAVIGERFVVGDSAEGCQRGVLKIDRVFQPGGPCVSRNGIGVGRRFHNGRLLEGGIGAIVELTVQIQFRRVVFCTAGERSQRQAALEREFAVRFDDGERILLVSRILIQNDGSGKGLFFGIGPACPELCKRSVVFQRNGNSGFAGVVFVGFRRHGSDAVLRAAADDLVFGQRDLKFLISACAVDKRIAQSVGAAAAALDAQNFKSSAVGVPNRIIEGAGGGKLTAAALDGADRPAVCTVDIRIRAGAGL